jgi:hypothetical protein
MASSTTWPGDLGDAVGLDPGAGAGEELLGLLVLDPHARAVEHLERRLMDVEELVRREDLEAQAAAPAVARLRVSSHMPSSTLPPGGGVPAVR